MSGRIKPAMSAEEWEHRGAPGAAWIDERGDLLQAHDEYDAPIERRHALAALALYGQPFGFTRADVNLLEDVARRDEGEYGPDEGDPGYPTALRDLADRIAALLPSE